MSLNTCIGKMIVLVAVINCLSFIASAQPRRRVDKNYPKTHSDSLLLLKRILITDTVAYVKGSHKPKKPRLEVKPYFFVIPPLLQIISFEPASPQSSKSLVVNFNFTNNDILKKPRTGYFRARAINAAHTITNQSDVFNISELPPGESITGKVTIKNISFEKNGIVELEYFDTYSSFYNKQLKKIISQSQLLSTDERDIVVLAPFVDLDNDGINDREENRLLRKFRPYYKFSKHYGSLDDYRPADVIWFLQRSELLTTDDEDASPIIDNKKLSTDPSSLLFTTGVAPWITEMGPSDLTVNHKATGYHINPLENVPNISDENPGRHGAEWSEVMSVKNIGLYGHVVPIWLNSPTEYDRKHKPLPMGTGKEFFKVEYWQFFGYNECHCGAAGLHEGDWITVQVLFDKSGESPDSIAAVYYYAHGIVEARFDLTGSQGPIPISLSGSNDSFVEFRGKNYSNDCYVDAKIITEDSDCSNNTVRFSQDPVTGHFTHPVVYIENGSHEPWPTRNGFFGGAPNHDGNDYEHSYLTNTPPNLGEVDSPSSIPGALQVLHFNGSWGAQYGGARGPTLHWQWTWPENSTTRSQIADDQFTD